MNAQGYVIKIMQKKGGNDDKIEGATDLHDVFCRP